MRQQVSRLPEDNASALLREAEEVMTHRSGWASPSDSEQGARSPMIEIGRAPAELVD